MAQSDSPLLDLRTGRAHEVCGAGAWAFACAQAGLRPGPVLWVRESWRKDSLLPAGIAAFFEPKRMLIATAKDQANILAVAEEALRDGSVPMVVMELPDTVGLTEGRRLQLAAQAGRSLALGIIPEGAGSNAAETRWHCAPIYHRGDSTLHRWKLIKNKSGTQRSWDVRWDQSARRFRMVPPTGDRSGFTGLPG